MAAEPTDEQLMARYQAGDAAAFETLLRRHRAGVLTFLARMVGDRTRAEDLMQETFLKVVKGARTWQSQAKFSTWLYTIARNLCIDLARREKFRKADSLDAAAGKDEDGRPLVETIPGDAASPDRGAENARMRLVIERAIAALPDDQREVFVLREYSGVPFKDIAELVGAPENTVKSRMRYALEALRKRLVAAGIQGDMADDAVEARLA